MGLGVSEMRRGMTIVYDGELYQIVEYEHSKRGRGGAMARTKLRHLKSGRVTTATFKGSENTESAFLESRSLQYLYRDATGYVFMDAESYEQVPLTDEVLGEDGRYLVEGIIVTGRYHQGELVAVDLPSFVELRVAETEPGVRGDTVSNVEKPATLESGAVISVPLFVKQGDLLKVDTRSGTYVERI